jgi:hypothetical protein
MVTIFNPFPANVASIVSGQTPKLPTADIYVIMVTGNCIVSDLEHDPNRFLYGAKVDRTNRTHVLSPSSTLHFGDEYNWVFHGRNNTIRGIVAESWSICQYSQDLDATMTVTWWFSGKG